MPPRIWIVVNTQGLKSNLMNLALASGGWELRFSDVPPRAPADWQGLTHLIVDDGQVKNARKLLKELKPGPAFRRLILLSGDAAGGKAPDLPWPCSCLTKPFDPKELKDMITQDDQAHESEA